MLDERQGIVHVIGPELGFSLPGQAIVSGDSHASTHGALGALAFGVGASEVEQVLATQTLVQEKALNMKIEVTGRLPFGTSAKDLALGLIGRIGAAGANGHAIEFCGDAVTSLGMEGRMTLCKHGHRGRRKGSAGGARRYDVRLCAGGARWPRRGMRSTAPSTGGAPSLPILAPRGTRPSHSTFQGWLPWSPGAPTPKRSCPSGSRFPDSRDEADPHRRAQGLRMLDYMGLRPGQSLLGLGVDVVFIGSCTNGRLEDLRAAAAVARGRRVASHVRALVVPGSGLVRRQAEQEGLDAVFRDAGFEWREAGCSMCLAMNGDRLLPGQRAASTSNRNFEGRQGPGGPDPSPVSGDGGCRSDRGGPGGRPGGIHAADVR